MEASECQRNGFKFDLGTGEPLKYLAAKNQKTKTESKARKIKT